MLLYTRLARPKLPKRRSRAGCTHCKAKKKKCNEERPQCNRCVERGLDCTYESVKPRQRRKRELASPTIAGTGATTSQLRVRTKPSYPPARKLSEEEGGSSDDSSHGERHHHPAWRQVSSPLLGSGIAGWAKNSRRLLMNDLDLDLGLDVPGYCGTTVLSPLEPAMPRSFDAISMMTSFPPSIDSATSALPPTDPLSCGFLLGLGCGEEHEMSERTHSNNFGSVSIGSERGISLGTRPSLVTHHRGPYAKAQTHGHHLDVAGSPLSVSVVPSYSHVRRRCPYPDLTVVAPSPVRSPLLESTAPSFSEFSSRPNRRALVDHFCNVLSHLIVLREETGNPFQQLVLPLSQRSEAVMDAIYALTCAHLEYRGVQNGERSLYFHNQAIQGLTKLIKQGSQVNRNELLAAIMLLVYYEVLVQKGRSNIVDGHLKGAFAIMCSNPEPMDPTSTFLERAFRFYDVITALSNGTAPLSAAPEAGCLTPLPPLGAPAGSPLSNVDTLLGMATTLWPIIHRLSALTSSKAELEKAVCDTARTGASTSKVAVLRTEFETSVSAIEIALTAWRPHLPAGFVPDSEIPGLVDDDNNLELGSGLSGTEGFRKPVDADLGPHLEHDLDLKGSKEKATTRNWLNSVVHNALAYKHSALVYLYRTIHGFGRDHGKVQQHTQAALRHCAVTVAARGPMGALLWPLFVAACEAVREADRVVARTAFQCIEKRQGMMNIERAWKIVEEVWKRADSGEEEGDVEEARAEEGVTMGGETGEECLSASQSREEQFARKQSGSSNKAMKSGEEVARPMAAGDLSTRTAAETMAGKAISMGRATVGFGRRQSGRRGADLWRRVSKDMGVNIVFG